MNLPLSTAFTVSHRFWVVVFSFSFVSMHILISFLISSMIRYFFLIWFGLAAKWRLTPAIPWTAAHQAPLSMGFSRQEYWSGLPFLSPWYLPKPGTESGSPALQADSLPNEPPGKLSLIRKCSNQCVREEVLEEAVSLVYLKFSG